MCRAFRVKGTSDGFKTSSSVGSMVVVKHGLVMKISRDAPEATFHSSGLVEHVPRSDHPSTS